MRWCVQQGGYRDTEDNTPLPLSRALGKPGENRENRGQRPFFLTREDLYDNIYLLWQEWQELSY